jgi:hypothetical protein
LEMNLFKVVTRPFNFWMSFFIFGSSISSWQSNCFPLSTLSSLGMLNLHMICCQKKLSDGSWCDSGDRSCLDPLGEILNCYHSELEVALSCR